MVLYRMANALLGGFFDLVRVFSDLLLSYRGGLALWVALWVDGADSNSNVGVYSFRSAKRFWSQFEVRPVNFACACKLTVS